MTLCSFHHTLVHENGFGVTVTDDGVFVFTRPDGKRIPESGSAVRIAPQIDETERFRGIVGGERFQGPAEDDGFRGTVAAEGFRGIVARLNPDPDVKIDAQTSRCKWLGERMDYSMAIEAMQFREINAATAPG